MKIWLAVIFTTTPVSFAFITVVILLLSFLIVEPIIRLCSIRIAQQLVTLAIKAQLLVTVSFTSLVGSRGSSFG